jgi:hypothetical protein
MDLKLLRMYKEGTNKNLQATNLIPIYGVVQSNLTTKSARKEKPKFFQNCVKLCQAKQNCPEHSKTGKQCRAAFINQP